MVEPGGPEMTPPTGSTLNVNVSARAAGLAQNITATQKIITASRIFMLFSLFVAPVLAAAG